MAWDHGYYSAAPYTSGFYRELAPNWLDFAALIKGQAPPRAEEGEPFSFLELGSGMGFGLCLLAATYPEAKFSGIDFQPDHIAHSQRLAASLGLTNVTFIEADFLSLAANPSPLGFEKNETGPFHYVVAHGIATWIIEPIQTALLQLAAAALIPGGIFYCSYNTYPGWLAASAIQQLSEQERKRRDPADAAGAFRHSSATLTALLGSEDSPSALAQAHPGLRSRLDKIPSQDSAYLLQEYGNDGWQPLYVAEMHRRCAGQKLRFLAAATLPENFEDLLPKNVQAPVLAETNPEIRQSLIDLATNKSFRRDIFVKGRVSLTITELTQRIAKIRFRLQDAPKTESYRFDTSFGTITGSPELYAKLENDLVATSSSFAELQASSGQALAATAKIVSLLLHNGRIGFDRAAASGQATASARQANNGIKQLIRQGRPYGYLAAPAIGSAVAFSLIDSLIDAGISDGLEGETLHNNIADGLSSLRRVPVDSDGKKIEDFNERLRFIANSVESYRAERQVRFSSLGL